MFTIAQKEINGFEIIELTDENTGTTAGIVPSCGAILYSFGVEKDGDFFNVIDSNKNRQEFETSLESNGFKGSKLSPFVCRLNNGQYHYGEKDFTIEKFYLGKNAIHGLIYDQPFNVIRQNAGTDRAEVEMEYEYKATDKGYPFYYTCNVKYKLEKENSLTITTTIINNDRGLIPVADGWHPYFTFDGSINDCQLEFQSKEMVAFDESLIPTGELTPYQEFGSLTQIGEQFFDNCFTVNFAECQPMLVFRNPDKNMQVEIRPHTSYPYLQIYTPDHRNSIAIENLSAAPDAYNNGMGLINLRAGGDVSFETNYQVVLLP